jgi:putative ABC transport system ATP-binding protein
MGESTVKALSDVDLEIKKGDFVAIIGPSGSGKSTMMNLVGALDLASRGDIYLSGQNIEHLGESELAQIRGRRIGFVFQTFNLIPTQTALGNVMLPMMFQDTIKEEREEKAIELLKKVGLGHRLYHVPAELSGGERQRVAIARALANDPEIILADEPTGNLDTKTGDEIMHMLVKLNKEGKTIILVTHDLEMAEHAKKIVRLKDGGIVR